MPPTTRTGPRLAPGAIARDLLCIYPDRDERAPQLCTEMLLTLVANGYAAPDSPDGLNSPKRQQFATRSLALGENFLASHDQANYGGDLARAVEIGGSTNLALAQQALEGLVDPSTQNVQRGAWLLRPFHESLLWYDSRRDASTGRWSVRKVHMRGTGITLARMLLAPAATGPQRHGRAAVDAIRNALTAPSPLAEISERLEDVLPAGQTYNRAPDTEDDERSAWERGADPRLHALAERFCRHAEGVMGQAGASGAARLWQLRSVIALDIATHIARTSWAEADAPESEQFLLLSFGGGPRAADPVRQKSEHFYRRSRLQIRTAVVQTLAERMCELHSAPVNWASEFEPRSGLGREDSIAGQLSDLSPAAAADDYDRIARAAAEVSDYDRGVGNSYRVLLESLGMLVGTGAYRYLTAGPDLLAALVGALSARMPMSSREFFAAIREEWGLVVNQEAAATTALGTLLDGAALERNARKAEKLMSDAGLALGLSDRTMMVGERARRTT